MVVKDTILHPSQWGFHLEWIGMQNRAAEQWSSVNQPQCVSHLPFYSKLSRTEK